MSWSDERQTIVRGQGQGHFEVKLKVVSRSGSKSIGSQNISLDQC